jgi:poly-D-alanine transfer protein DltD
LQSQNTGLTRDNAVKGALAGIEFRNDVAADMAYDRVVSQMTQDANGQWVHKSGVSISEFVQMFSKDEANSFLMKAKVNTGTGSAAMAAGAPDTSSSKSITEMNTNELLEHFAKQAPNGNFGF